MKILESVDVRGRGELVANVRLCCSYGEDTESLLSIRLDDDRNDEFWAEVTLTREQLEAAIQSMDAVKVLARQYQRGIITEDEYETRLAELQEGGA